jgi:hypothetical protein
MGRDYDLAALRREAAEAHTEGHCSPNCEHLRQAWLRGFAQAKREEREAQHDVEEWPEPVCRVDWVRALLIGVIVAALFLAGCWTR